MREYPHTGYYSQMIGDKSQAIVSQAQGISSSIGNLTKCKGFMIKMMKTTSEGIELDNNKRENGGE